MKNILIFFDGTGNDPADAAQRREWLGFGELEDDSISNVLKLRLLLGGNLDNTADDAGQLCYYYSGVGTYGGGIRRTINSWFGFQNLDVERIQNRAFDDIARVYEPGDRLFVFGFSRGAAIARQFCSRRIPRLADPDHPTPVEFLGVFDTVAAINFPNLDNEEYPISDVVFENRHIAKTIRKALHLVSLDDKRKAFQPTLMNREDKVTEIWFAGAHSDIGGGFRRDGLSDITLQFMLDALRDGDYGLRLVNPRKIDYAAMRDDDDVEIDYSDVMLNPNPFGHIHLQARPLLTSRVTLGNRPVVVMEDDRPCDELPLVHHSVAERIYRDPDYKPQSLYQTPHRVYRSDEDTEVFDGLGEHRELGRMPCRQLQAGESRRLGVYANRLYNHSGVMMLGNQEYRFEVDRAQQWHDSSIATNVEGWDVDDDDIDIGWVREAVIRRKEEDRRGADARWFELCAAVGESERATFRLLEHVGDDAKPFRPSVAGEFLPFANDLADRYANNLGFIDITITRVA